jgi:hypothetical protein
VKLLRLLLPPVVPHFWLLTRKTHFLSPLQKHFRFVIQEEIEQKEVASNFLLAASSRATFLGLFLL